jgi:hypothetical protein
MLIHLAGIFAIPERAEQVRIPIPAAYTLELVRRCDGGAKVYAVQHYADPADAEELAANLADHCLAPSRESGNSEEVSSLGRRFVLRPQGRRRT